MLCLAWLETPKTGFLMTQLRWLKEWTDLSRRMRKPTICICENKDADQLRGNREADRRLCFRYTGTTIPLLLKSRNFKLLALFRDCTGRFVSALVGNHIVGFPTRWLIYCSLIMVERINRFSIHEMRCVLTFLPEVYR